MRINAVFLKCVGSRDAATEPQKTGFSGIRARPGKIGQTFENRPVTYVTPLGSCARLSQSEAGRFAI